MVVLSFISIFYTILFAWFCGIAAGTALVKTIPMNYRVFAWLIIFLVLMETAYNIVAFNHIKNHFLFNIAETIQFFGVGWFFYTVIQNPALRKSVWVFLWIFPFFALVNNVWIQGFYNLNTFTYIIGGGFIVLLCVAYLWQLYFSDDTQSIFRDPVFWITLAYLFYCAILVPYIGMLDYLWKKYPGFTRSYHLRVFYVGIIVHKLLLTAGFLCMRVSPKRS
jgi:hypothetical protein